VLLVSIELFPSSLSKILFNLLGNAVKFSHKGGVIDFSVQLVDSNNSMDASLQPHNNDDRSPNVASVMTTPPLATNPTLCAGKDETAPTKKEVARGGGGCGFVVYRGGGQDEVKNRDTPHQGSHCQAHQSDCSAQLAEEGHFSDPGAHAMGATDDDDDVTRQDKCSSRQQELATDTTTASTTTAASLRCWKGMKIRFEIKDYGQGISPDAFESIFYPFHQTRAGQVENVYGGTGLGLAITKKLVNGLGGTISVDSVEKQWSKFTVDLPFMDSPVDRTALSAALQHVSVLLVLGDSSTSPELACATNVLGEYQLEARSFETLADLTAAVLRGDYCLQSDRSYVCLVHVDQYDTLGAKALTDGTGDHDVTLVTVGKKKINGTSDGKITPHHIRSLEQMIPCTLLKTILRISEGKRHNTKPAAVKSDAVHEGMNRLRILLAEDNVVNVKVMMRMLSRIGVKHVDIAPNGEEAVAAEAAKVYDLILMDMSMPIMDGPCAARLICARHQQQDDGGGSGGELPKNHCPKIVFVTAHVSADFEEQCRQAGGSGFLPKPFKVDEIEKCLRNICSEIETEEDHDDDDNRIS
jgi:CheY-like chemotaxis protein